MGTAAPRCRGSASGTLPLDRAGPTLPDDRGMDGTAGLAFPHDGRLALVGDADRRELVRRETCARESFAAHRDRCREDLAGIVFDVRGRRIRLPDLSIGATPD